jgi:O-antigen/teichoic acid export membrane protein
MWGVPFGVALTLFGPDLVRFGLGERWRAGVTLIQAFGAIAAFNHIAFNWDAFFRAHGRTRPIAVWSLTSLAAFLVFALPLLIVDGLDGYAIGMGATTAVSLIVRAVLLTRMLPGLRILRHTVRAIGPTVPAVAFVLVARVAESGSRTLALAVAEVVGYAAVTALATLLLERALLGEVRGYLRSASPTPTPAAASGASA